MARLSLEERRSQLVEVATQIALDKGVEAVTTRAVASAAGVRPSVVYYCFADMHELVAAMAQAIGPIAASYLDAALVSSGRGAAAQLHALAEGLLRTLEARRHYQLLLVEIAVLGARDDRLREVALAQQREQWAASEEYLRRVASGAGLRFTVDVGVLARMVSAQIDGIQIAWMVDHDQAAARTSFHALADAAAAYLEPDPESGPASAPEPAPEAGPVPDPEWSPEPGRAPDGAPDDGTHG